MWSMMAAQSFAFVLEGARATAQRLALVRARLLGGGTAGGGHLHLGVDLPTRQLAPQRVEVVEVDPALQQESCQVGSKDAIWPDIPVGIQL